VTDAPLVSVVLATRDRPRLLPLALEWYRRQTYPNRELVVVDDGEDHPVAAAAVERLGGRVLRLEEVTPLGTKLNLGCEAARGPICAKLDDDDWYAPRYLETMVAGLRGPAAAVCRPTMAFLTPFRFFDVANWLIRRSDDGNVPGATLVFTRENWAEAPFRALTSNEDMWFCHDQRVLGVLPRPVTGLDVYLAVRHADSAHDRGHQWRRQWHGEDLDSYLLRRPVEKTPEALLPRWAVARYRDLRRELVAARPQLASV
jgi:glycosyltransferase involved in cell wall biosynthesis